MSACLDRKLLMLDFLTYEKKRSTFSAAYKAKAVIG